MLKKKKNNQHNNISLKDKPLEKVAFFSSKTKQKIPNGISCKS